MTRERLTNLFGISTVPVKSEAYGVPELISDTLPVGGACPSSFLDGVLKAFRR